MIINMNGAKAPETPSPVLQEKTITPETLPTVIGADEGYDGLSQVTVNPDSQLKAENIRSGKTIFGVEGSFVGEAISTPVPYGSVLAPFSGYLTSILVTSTDTISSLKTGIYSGPINYMRRFGQIVDSELKRIVGPNTFTTSIGSFMDQYLVSYEGGTKTISSGMNVYLPQEYNVLKASAIDVNVKFLVCCLAAIDTYDGRRFSDLFRPLEVVEAECTLSTSALDSFYLRPKTDMVINIPQVICPIARTTVESYIGYSSAKPLIELRVYPIDVKYDALFE